MDHKKQEKKASQKKRDIAQQIVEQVVRMQHIDTDPLGSYTGRPADQGERPVQDADDL